MSIINNENKSEIVLIEEKEDKKEVEISSDPAGNVSEERKFVSNNNRNVERIIPTNNSSSSSSSTATTTSNVNNTSLAFLNDKGDSSNFDHQRRNSLTMLQMLKEENEQIRQEIEEMRHNITKNEMWTSMLEKQRGLEKDSLEIEIKMKMHRIEILDTELKEMKNGTEQMQLKLVELNELEKENQNAIDKAEKKAKNSTSAAAGFKFS